MTLSEFTRTPDAANYLRIKLTFEDPIGEPRGEVWLGGCIRPREGTDGLVWLGECACVPGSCKAEYREDDHCQLDVTLIVT